MAQRRGVAVTCIYNDDSWCKIDDYEKCKQEFDTVMNRFLEWCKANPDDPMSNYLPSFLYNPYECEVFSRKSGLFSKLFGKPK
jgi:hypothetical protein